MVANHAKLTETSPVAQASKITVPVLLIHGEADVVVPVAHSRDMADALKSVGHKTHKYLELPMADHWLSREPDRVEVFREIEEFLKSHLD